MLRPEPSRALRPTCFLLLLAAVVLPAAGQDVAWKAWNARTQIKLDPNVLADLGIAVDWGRPTAKAGKEGYVGFGSHSTSRLEFIAPGGDLEALDAGSIVHHGGPTLEIRGARYPLESFELRFAGAPMRFDLLDAEGRRFFRVENSQFMLELGELRIVNTDLVVAPELAALLGDARLAGQWLGTLDVVLDVAAPPGEKMVPAAGECDVDAFSPKDVALISIGALSQLVREPGGRVAIAPSATLKNVGGGTVPWFRSITPDGQVGQHPYLAMHLYRVAGGVIEQVGRGDVKHAFLTINSVCPCAAGHQLYKNCEDVYGVSTNASRFQLAPRDELTASTGDWQSLGSHFDGFPVDDFRSHGGDGDHDDFEHRVVVQEADLETAGAQYFIEAWYIVKDDVDIWNGIGYREVAPALASGIWTFPFVTGLAGGAAIDAWVDPAAPGAGNASVRFDSGEGHLQLAVETSAAAGGGTHYEYALMNLDFDRQISSFSIPLPAGATVSSTGFGDVDDDPSNDWTAAVDANGVTFTAPGGNGLDWGTLFNFRFDVDAAGGDGTATLGILEPGSGLQLFVDTVVPGGAPPPPPPPPPSVIPCSDLRSFTASCKKKGGLSATLSLRTGAHDGETVVFGVDGAPVAVVVGGRRAKFQDPSPASGPHTLSLEDPAGCVAPVNVTCR